MKILITGATGFVGRNLVKELDRQELTLIVRDVNKAISYFGTKPEYIEIEHMSYISKIKFDVVIHLAAYLTSNDNIDSLEKIVESNINFGLKLLNFLKVTPPELFINFGTFAQYRYGPQSKDDAYLYSASKTAFEAFLKYYSESYGFHYVNVIPYTIYGGKDKQKKIIDLLKESLDSTNPIELSGGEQILDFIHVNDVINFIKYIINHIIDFKDGEDKDFFLGTGKGTSIRQLAHLLENKYNKKCNISWGAVPYRRNDIMYAVAPLGPLVKYGWRPTHNLEENI